MAVTDRRLVVLRPLGLGDLLAAVPALRALRSAYPRHRLTLAGPARLAPLALLSGAVDEVVDARPLRRLDDSLRRANVSVNLHGKGPDSHEVLLQAAPRQLVAFSHPRLPETAGMPGWRAEEHETQRWCRLLSESGIPADPDDLELRRPQRTSPTREAVGVTVIHPGAASPARCWPFRRYAAVARSEASTGRRVLITGGQSEAALAHAVAAAAGLGDGAVLAGRTDLMDFAAIIAGADRLVCGDTGAAHLATAFRTPSVVLFGPSSPSQWGPPPDRAFHRVLWDGETGDPHRAAPSPGLLRIDVEDVLRALVELDVVDWARG